MTTDVLSVECPKVSICCISFNHELYIRDALDSFLSQKTSFQYEIVISDDCSDDGTYSVICDYKKLYPDIIKDVSPRYNMGVLANWWHVQNSAKGRYVALCEGDDYWTDPYKLQKQVDFLETHQDYSMCFHGADVKNETNTKKITSCDTIEEKEYRTNDIFPGWVIPTASVVYRRDMVEKYPPLKHQNWMKYGDIVLFLKCTHTGRVWGMKNIMSVYRMTNNGAVVSQYLDPNTQYKLTLHYRFLMNNFPLLDKRWPKAYIATYYYTKFRNDQGISNKIKAFFVALYYSPKYVIQKLLKMQPHGTY